ncbi:AraC family transcriptional regulator [Alkalibacillus haloalkaliphilus]|uniref:AraC family transcriptional regulator n=1 Tax=Alkalibacillus haloalkaliphilus TaxID=94136 RepID=A0A511W1I4_9BACI|nr:helix-turn-helix domain-containing protein [Alkalibacillus haloalkaliphilus]GEN44621.1 AraC family transcriptional regulator [Alkalibacillus haloalkaliphilus]
MNTLLHSDVGLFLLRQNFDQESDWRSDNCYKFVFSVGGATNYQTNRQEMTMSQHQFLMFNPSEDHKQIAVDHSKFLVELDRQMLNELSSSIYNQPFEVQFASLVQFTNPVSQWTQFIIRHLKVLEDEPLMVKQSFLDHNLTSLSIILLNNAVSSHIPDINLSHYNVFNAPISKTLTALKDDYKSNWTLEDMAKVANLSKYQFAHVFKELIGISPYSWLQVYRLVRSQQLLKYTNLTILEIALECGFSSVNVYNRLFNMLYGKSPGHFRKIVR